MPRFDGSISVASEVDTYSVFLTAGLRYFVEVQGDPDSATPLSDSTLTVDGGDLPDPLEDDDGGLDNNARISFVPTLSAFYTIDVRGFSTTTGDYRLFAFADDFRNSAEGVGRAGAIAPGQSATGTLNYAGDADVFAVSMIEGLTYTIRLNGVDLGLGALRDPHVFVVDSSDQELGDNDDAGGSLNSLLQFTAPDTGQLFVQARDFGDDEGGSYRVSVSIGRGTAGADNITGTEAPDTIDGLAGNDRIDGRGGADRLFGGAGDDTLIGGIRADVLLGGPGADALFGQQGPDTLRGLADGDRLVGGTEADILIGGLARDTFVFAAGHSLPGQADRLRAGDGAAAFQGAGTAPGDLIDLSAIDANLALPGNNAFAFGSAGRGGLTLANAGANTVVRGNVDLDDAPEFTLVIEDGAVLASAYSRDDFIL